MHLFIFQYNLDVRGEPEMNCQSYLVSCRPHPSRIHKRRTRFPWKDQQNNYFIQQLCNICIHIVYIINVYNTYSVVSYFCPGKNVSRHKFPEQSRKSPNMSRQWSVNMGHDTRPRNRTRSIWCAHHSWLWWQTPIKLAQRGCQIELQFLLSKQVTTNNEYSVHTCMLCGQYSRSVRYLDGAVVTESYVDRQSSLDRWPPSNRTSILHTNRVDVLLEQQESANTVRARYRELSHSGLSKSRLSHSGLSKSRTESLWSI